MLESASIVKALQKEVKYLFLKSAACNAAEGRVCGPALDFIANAGVQKHAPWAKAHGVKKRNLRFFKCVGYIVSGPGRKGNMLSCTLFALSSGPVPPSDSIFTLRSYSLGDIPVACRKRREK